jgi:hypothetical protein
MGTQAQEETEIWGGAYALAQALDHMVENKIDSGLLAANLEDCGADSSAVIRSMIDSGLFVEVLTTSPPKRELTLTQVGRLVIIHATSCL